MIVTTAVAVLPLPSATVYENVSVPAKCVAGMYVKLPPPLSVRAPSAIAESSNDAARACRLGVGVVREHVERDARDAVLEHARRVVDAAGRPVDDRDTNVCGGLVSMPPFAVPPSSTARTLTVAAPCAPVAGVNVSVPSAATAG